MARTKEFDPDAVLRSAIELFWRQGYEATSMQDLVEHLGIGRASIYATFGSKRDLYLKAFERYREGLGGRYGYLLTRPGPVLPAVRELIESMARESLADPDCKGCMVTNTAVEMAADDAQLRSGVDDSISGFEAAVEAVLHRARSDGELGAEKDPRGLARFLVTVVQGIRVVGKLRDEQRLRDAVDSALSILD